MPGSYIYLFDGNRIAKKEGTVTSCIWVELDSLLPCFKQSYFSGTSSLRRLYEVKYKFIEFWELLLKFCFVSNYKTCMSTDNSHFNVVVHRPGLKQGDHEF